jgi:hypothetical protein
MCLRILFKICYLCQFIIILYHDDKDIPLVIFYKYNPYQISIVLEMHAIDLIIPKKYRIGRL